MMKKSREEEKKKKKSSSNSQTRSDNTGSSATPVPPSKTRATKPQKKEGSVAKDIHGDHDQCLEKHLLQSLEVMGLAYNDIFPYFFEEINQTYINEEGSDEVYVCPEISDDVLTKRDWQQKIMQEYIMVVLESDPILASILMVRLLNPKEKAEECFSVIKRYLKNIIDNPENDRYRHIRYQNPIVISKVLETKGALMFLLIIGFEIDADNEGSSETFLSFNENHFHLKAVINLINDAKGFELRPVEDVDLNDEKQSRAASIGSHGDTEDFYKLTSADLKRNQALRVLEIEKESQLRTKSMREKEKRSVPKSKETKIRIRTPEGKLIDSEFKISDKLSKVYDFIEENFSNGKKYTLLVPPATPFKETDRERTLADLQLYPAVVLTMNWADVENIATKGKKVKNKRN